MATLVLTRSEAARCLDVGALEALLCWEFVIHPERREGRALRVRADAPGPERRAGNHVRNR